MKERCAWADGGDDAMLRYHDTEWGIPSRDPIHLFELLTLEGAQAGLSWSTILRKRQGYRDAFAGFDVAQVARFGARDVRRLMNDPGIVRNRLKIGSTIANAKAIIVLSEPFEDVLWSFCGGRPRRNRFRVQGDIPAQTDASRAMSAALKGYGFRFVGPTVCYALMQAAGMVNDHVVGCFRERECARLVG